MTVETMHRITNIGTCNTGTLHDCGKCRKLVQVKSEAGSLSIHLIGVNETCGTLPMPNRPLDDSLLHSCRSSTIVDLSGRT